MKNLGPKQIETMKLSLGPLLCLLWPVGSFHSSKTLHDDDDEVVVVGGRKEEAASLMVATVIGVTKNSRNERRHPTRVYRQTCWVNSIQSHISN